MLDFLFFQLLPQVGILFLQILLFLDLKFIVSQTDRQTDSHS